MPRLKNVCSLQEICLYFLAKNINKLTKDYYLINQEDGHKIIDELKPDFGYFNSTYRPVDPRLLMRVLLKAKQFGKVKIRHLRILVSETLRVFRFTSTNGIPSKEVVEFLSKRCQNLRQLFLSCNLEDANPENYQSFNSAIKRFQELRILHFPFLDIDDRVVVTIATHCSKLRILNISGTNVTDIGIFSLVKGDFHHILQSDFVMPSVVKNTLVRLNVEQTDVTTAGIVDLLMLLHLQSLICDCLIKACFEIVRLVGPDPDALVRIPVFPFPQICQLFTPDEYLKLLSVPIMKDVFKMCSKARAIILIDVPVSFLESYLPLTVHMNITELKITITEGGKELCFSEICHFLNSKGRSLTKLTLENFKNLDLAFIALRCRNISLLSLFGNGMTGFLTGVDCFDLLEELLISCDEIKMYRIQNLKVLASRPKLTKLTLFTDELTDHDFSDILEHTSFPSLQTLMLESCNAITVETLWKFVKLKNPLKVLDIITCLQIDFEDCIDLMSFIKVNNLDLKMSVQ